MTMTTTEFRSPSGRLVLSVEGRSILGETDIEWLRYVGGRPGLINERIERKDDESPVSETERATKENDDAPSTFTTRR